MTELETLRKSNQLLRAKHEQAEGKVAEFRSKLRDTRQELSTRERQLDVAKRMLTNVSNEKSRAEVKKLEAKPKTPSDVSPTQAAKAVRLQTKLSDQREQLQQAEARMLLAEETSLQLSQEVHVLKRALGMKKSQADGALDSQTKMAYQLAKSQEESTTLAVQLSEAQRAMQELQERLEVSVAKVHELQETQTESKLRLHEARQQAAESMESADQARLQASRLQSALDKESTARSRAEQQALLHQDKAQQLTERLQSIERASRLSIEALRSEVALAVERSESRAAEHRAGWAVKEAQHAERTLMLQRALDAVKVQLREEQEARAVEGERARQAAEAHEDEAERHKRAEREHAMEIGRLHGQIDAVTDLNRTLQARLDSCQDKAATNLRSVVELEEEREHGRRLKDQVELLQGQVRSVLDESAVREQGLQAQVQALRQELAAGSLGTSKLHAELHSSRQQLLEHGDVQAYVQELLRTVEALTQSKSKLQSHMLEQLSVFKSQLQRAEDDNKSLRAALAARGAGQQSVLATRNTAFPDSDSESYSFSPGPVRSDTSARFR